MYNSGTTLHQGRYYATPTGAPDLKREVLRYTKGGTTLHQGRYYATPRPLFSTAVLPYSSLRKVPVTCVAPNNKSSIFFKYARGFRVIDPRERPPLTAVIDLTVKVREFLSFGRSFFNTDALRGRCVIEWLSVVSVFCRLCTAPFGACTQLPTIAMDPAAHSPLLTESSRVSSRMHGVKPSPWSHYQWLRC